MEPPKTCLTEVVKSEPGRRLAKSVLGDILDVDDKMEVVQNRLDQIQSDLGTQTNLITECSSRLDAHDTSTNSLKTAITSNTTGMLENSEVVKDVKNELDDLYQDVASQNNRLNFISDTLTDQSKRLDAIFNSVHNQNNRLAAISNTLASMNSLSSRISMLEARLSRAGIR